MMLNFSALEFISSSKEDRTIEIDPDLKFD